MDIPTFLANNQGSNDEPFEVFQDRVFQYSPPPPPSHDSSDIPSSYLDQNIFTPLLSSPGDQPLDFQEVQASTYGTETAGGSLPMDEYASSLVISSPSDSSSGMSDVPGGGDNDPCSPFSHQASVSQLTDPYNLHQFTTSHYLASQAYRESLALNHGRYMLFSDANSATSVPFGYGTAGLMPSLSQNDDHHMSSMAPRLVPEDLIMRDTPQFVEGSIVAGPGVYVDGTTSYYSSFADHHIGSAGWGSLNSSVPQQLRHASFPGPFLDHNAINMTAMHPSSSYPGILPSQVSAVSGQISTMSPSFDRQQTLSPINTQQQNSQRLPFRAAQSIPSSSATIVPKNRVQSPKSPVSSPPFSISSPDSITFKKKRGGRTGGLDRQGRKEAAELRGTACWPCAVMREKCSKGDPCVRCSKMSERSKAYGLGCDRRHLKLDMMVSFIPASMDPKTFHESILSYLTRDIGVWNDTPRARRGIEVPFSIGIGDALNWSCHEYVPVSELSMQSLSWRIEGQGGHWKRTYKRSPPLAIKMLKPEYLEEWIERLIQKDLEDVGDMYYWEGHPMRNDMVKLFCTLYGDLREDESLDDNSARVRDDVRLVIRLILVTYIMNHAFTVEESKQSAVIRQMTRFNNPDLYEDMLILRTANSQLKLVFSRYRYKWHLELLNRLQTIMRNAKYKDWWLSAFIIMLGLTLTLEEYQHLLHVQADSRQQQRGTDKFVALSEAQTNCAAIDDGYDFLMKLYHYKYSARNEQKAAFPYRNEVPQPAEREFVDRLNGLLRVNFVVLTQRQDLPICYEEDNHVLRLAGRFLTGLI